MSTHTPKPKGFSTIDDTLCLRYAEVSPGTVRSEAEMRIFFDVDRTLLYYDGNIQALRPHTRRVFEELYNQGHQIYVWTATGKPHADRLVETYDLGAWVSGCYEKDPSISLKPDIVVDDDAYLVDKYSGVWVTPYRDLDPHDRELLKVLEAVAPQETPSGKDNS